MTANNGNNGSAFPVSANDVDNGMTLRDYFAAKALVGLLSLLQKDVHYEILAQESYKFADAMLAARSSS